MREVEWLVTLEGEALALEGQTGIVKGTRATVSDTVAERAIAGGVARAYIESGAGRGRAPRASSASEE